MYKISLSNLRAAFPVFAWHMDLDKTFTGRHKFDKTFTGRHKTIAEPFSLEVWYDPPEASGKGMCRALMVQIKGQEEDMIDTDESFADDQIEELRTWFVGQDIDLRNAADRRAAAVPACIKLPVLFTSLALDFDVEAWLSHKGRNAIMTPDETAYALTFGRLIWTHRKALGLTQDELAIQASSSQASIARIERGRVLPDVFVVSRLFDALGQPGDMSFPETVAMLLERAQEVAASILREESTSWERVIQVGGPSGIAGLIQFVVAAHLAVSSEIVTR